MKWIEDPAAEAKMREFGVEFEVGIVKLADIDWVESRTNGARLIDPVIDDLTQEYGLAMERGDSFPRIIVLKRKGKLYIIISGNHRGLAAKLLDLTEIQCYIVTTTDEAVIDLLPRVLNRLHGKRQDREEAMLHAIHAVTKYGFNSKKAEEAFGLPRDAVAREMRVRETRSVLEKNGVNTSKLTAATVAHLRAIGNENTMAAAANVAARSGMNTDQLKEFVAEIKKNKTEATQMAVVAKMETQTKGMDPGPVLKIPRNVRTKFISSLTTLENRVDGVTKLSQVQITDHKEAEEMRKRIGLLIENLRALLNQAGKKTDKGGHRRRSA